MNFDVVDSDSAFRQEVSELLDKMVTPELIARCRQTGTLHDWELHRAMGERGWFARGWPREYGGDGVIGSLDPLVLREELDKRGTPAEAVGMTLMVARVILEVGSEEAKRTVIPRALRGEILLCLGYTETHGGSDAAGARTAAVKDGENWVINGHKMFTTFAEEAEYVFLLTRTDFEAAKHRGLTLFLVPLDSPGVEIQPVHTIGDERTNATYYADVVVPDSARVGEVNEGWRVMTMALMLERNGASNDVRLLDAAVAAARQTLADTGDYLIDDPLVRDRLARIAIEREVATLLARRSQWGAMKGSTSLVEGSMFKLFSAETEVRAAADLVDIFGAAGAVEHGESGAPW
jgi:alkylation response protein AidB-like acyl-CoA dehydrogenase